MGGARGEWRRKGEEKDRQREREWGGGQKPRDLGVEAPGQGEGSKERDSTKVCM